VCSSDQQTLSFIRAQAELSGVEFNVMVDILLSLRSFDVLTATKVQAIGSKEDVQGQEVAVLQIVYVGSLIHSTTQSSPDTSQAE